MKQLLVILLAVSVNQLCAQPWKTVKGNHHSKKESRTVGEFSSLLSKGPLDVKITAGHSDKIEIMADENLLPYIETEVENGKLIIRTKNYVNLKSSSKMVVYVSMEQIKTLQLSGSGNIESEGSLSGAENTNIQLSGSGNIRLNSGTFKDLKMAISGSGGIDVNGGTAENLAIAISGSGNITVNNLAAENVDVKISGSGNAKVNANKSLTATISGSGNIYYKGSAKSISSKTAGSGKIIKI